MTTVLRAAWRWTTASAVALAALGAPVTSRAQMVTYVSDALTAAPSGGASPGVTAGARGGTFGPGGWTTTGPTDTIWWVIPATMPRGRVEVTATGLSIATSLTGQEHDLIGIYGATDRAEPVPYSPWYRNNEFKVFVRIFGDMNRCAGCQAVGASKLELALCPALAVSGYVESMCPAACVAAGYDFWQAYLGPRGRGEELPWDAATEYRFVISWEPGRMTYSRGGPEGPSSLTFPGTYAPPRELRVRLGPPSSERGPDVAMPRGVTFRNVLVQGEPGPVTPSCAAPLVDAGPVPGDASAPGAMTLEFPAVEDVTVNQGQPSTVYPDVRDLAVETDAQAYVKFRVGALPGRVVRAQLVMRTATSSSAAGSGASVFRAAHAAWSEATLTWSARPGPTGERLARASGLAVDTAYEFDVTSAVAAPGTFAFVLATDPTDTNGVHFDSKEVSPVRGPILRITVDPSMPLPATDAGAPPAGDAGVPAADSGAATTRDAGRALDGARTTGGGVVEGGCGCRVPASPARAPAREWVALAALLGAIARARRRRRA